MSNRQPNQYAREDDQSRTQDDVLIYIKDMLSSVPLTPPEHSIFRVRHQLRSVNEKAYDPETLAIGPYHYGNNKFKFMEKQKMQYVQQLLQRRNESVDRYMPTLGEMEQRARDCYAETFDLSRESFQAMMLIDGCFMIELFREYSRRDKDDPRNEAGWIQLCLSRDLLLLENQLPLFVLNELYDLTKGPDEHLELIHIATSYFGFELQDPSQYPLLRESKHILHLMHTCWTSGLAGVNGKTPQMEENFMFKPSATELRESGVRLEAVPTEKRHVMDIRFEKGRLQIPIFTVEGHTESKFRNLIAYEQHRPGRDINYVTDYMALMDCLINSSKDVKLLRGKGIIENYMGDDEVAAQMFNKIGDSVVIYGFYYQTTLKNMTKHWSKKWNRRMAKLRFEYFHSPWALVSFLAAILLLVLTLAQTLFTILSYAKR